MRRFLVGAMLFSPVLLVIGVLGFNVWAAVWADCMSIGWLPLTSTPARCLRVHP